MAEKYKVRVNESMEFEFTKDQLSAPDIQKTSSQSFHVLQDSRSYNAELTHLDFLQKNLHQVDILPFPGP